VDRAGGSHTAKSFSPTNGVIEELALQLQARPPRSKAELMLVIKQFCSQHRLTGIPGKTALLSATKNILPTQLLDDLKVKPVRSASGIVVVSVMPKPYPCPHGTCIYCPGGVRFGVTQSYTGSEPASMKAIELGYDPFRQVEARIRQFERSGHNPSKVELVIIGGTFLAYPQEYQEEFVKRSFDALNGVNSPTLESAHRLNEVAARRCVGLTFETKPEYCLQDHVDRMLHFGGTRVEIGVQALRDEVYRLVNRGHTLKDVKDAFQIARDSGLKIVAHMMPGLPGSSPESDLEDFRRLFEDQEFRPDMLKIYPTLVLPGTGLEKLYLNKSYVPYQDAELITLLVEVKRMVPRWIRIMRIQREIPAQSIIGGTKRGNLRQLVKAEMQRRGLTCKCIRCREVGLNTDRSTAPLDLQSMRISSERYEAGGGEEHFLAAEAAGLLLGFVRLRTPSDGVHRPELKGNTAIIRELHVYGNLVPVGEKSELAWQHRGIGATLMAEAERKAEEQGARKIAVMSAVGTRNYYRKLGYFSDGPYMSKHFK